jgi:hypothetical protein
MTLLLRSAAAFLQDQRDIYDRLKKTGIQYFSGNDGANDAIPELVKGGWNGPVFPARLPHERPI